MQQRKKVEVTCNYCNQPFQKDLSEVKRSERIGRKHYCSLTCSGKVTVHTNIPKEKVNRLFDKVYSKADEFTGIREHLRRAKRRTHTCDLSLEYLLSVWQEQKGICVYSGVQLQHGSYKQKNDPIYTASLDRIDSSKGYVEGNIQFISIAMNHMKNDMTDEQVKELIKILKGN